MPTDKTIYYGGSTTTYTVTENGVTFSHAEAACAVYEYSITDVTDMVGNLPSWLTYTDTNSVDAVFEFQMTPG